MVTLKAIKAAMQQRYEAATSVAEQPIVDEGNRAIDAARISRELAKQKRPDRLQLHKEAGPS